MHTHSANGRRNSKLVAAMTAAGVALSLALATSPSSAIPPPDPMPDPEGGTTVSVTGMVVDAEDGSGLAGATVHASRTGISTLTAADGSFELPDVPESSALVVAGMEGYAFSSTAVEDEIVLELSADTDPARGEYPRPDADRRPFTEDRWLTLDGTWSFDFDPEDVGVQEGWFDPEHRLSRAIRVPFGYQSLAAWGEESLATNEIFRSYDNDYRGTVWYQRSFTVPENFDGDRTRLRIGAADWGAGIWLDGEEVLPYTGDGNTEISVDLGRLEPGATHTVAIRVVAPPTTPESPYPQGKQTGQPREGEETGWFTDIGGIWQSVWIEPYGDARVTQAHVTPELEFEGESRTPSQATAVVGVAAEGADQVSVTVRDPGGEVVEVAEVTLADGQGTTPIDIPDVHLWEPDDPALYTADVEIAGQDGVRTTFGMRSITRDWAPETDEYQYIHLNNRPIFVRGVLDQGYNPWGVYTYTGVTAGPDLQTGTESEPGRGSILYDMLAAKEQGYNVIRTHLKVNEPTYYHLADQLGLMIWQDLPNAGWLSAGDPEAEVLFEEMLTNTIERDYNHPSIVIWTMFNEAWGISDDPWNQPIPEDSWDYVAAMVERTRELDPSRLVVDNSACCQNGHVADTDLNDFHFYLNTYDQWKDLLDRFGAQVYPGSTWNFNNGAQSGQPWLNSEFTLGLGRFQHIMSTFRSYERLNGYVAVQLTDQEHEENTPLTFDRQPNVPPYLDHEGNPRHVGMLQADDAIAMVGESTRTVEAGETISVPIKISHFSDHDLQGATLHWRIGGHDAEGEWVGNAAEGSQQISPERYTVTDADTVEVQAPDELRSGYLWFWIEIDGETIAENYLTYDVPNEGPAAFSPLTPTDYAWSGGTEVSDADGSDSVTGYGRGHFEYEMSVPEGVLEQEQATLVLEVAAAQPDGWYDTVHASAARRYPTQLSVEVNGTEQAVEVLPDDPYSPLALAGRSRDSVGDHGANYGYRIAVPIDVGDLDGDTATVRLTSSGGGLALFGERSGFYGDPPRIEPGVVEVPDTRPAPSAVDDRLSVYQVGAEISGADGSGQVVVAVVNDTDETVSDAQVRLSPPRDWTTEAVDATTLTLEPGEGGHVVFDVATDQPVGLHTEADFTATVVWGNRAIQAIATSRVPFEPEAYPAVGVDDDFATDTSAEYQLVQPNAQEALPEITIGDGALTGGGDEKYFGFVTHESGPASAEAAVIVDHGSWAGNTTGQNTMFAGYVKDADNYIVAWTSTKGQVGFDFRLDGQFSNSCCTNNLTPLGEGDRWAVVLAGEEVQVWFDYGLGWTKVRTAALPEAAGLTARGALDGWHYAAGMRGVGDQHVIAGIEGRSVDPDGAADTTRPEVELVSPGSDQPAPQIDIQVDATDDVGLDRIVANVYQGGELVESTQSQLDGEPSGSHTATVTVPDGSYTIRYNAHDLAGNVSATGSSAVVVDATAPTATVKTGPEFTVGGDGVYTQVSFKLFDAGKIDRVVVNDYVLDLVNNSWSDVNGIRPGHVGGVLGENTLVVYDIAGNTETVTFALE